MPDLSDLVPFHPGQVGNFNLLVIGQVQNLYKVNFVFHILINHYEFTCCIENSVDPDQLASAEASRSGSPLFTRELISAWFHTAFQSVNCLSTERYKLICTIGQVNFLWTSTFWPFTCPWTSRKYYYFHTPGFHSMVILGKKLSPTHIGGSGWGIMISE